MTLTDDAPLTLLPEHLEGEVLARLLETPENAGRHTVLGRWYRFQLGSAFQPIVDPASGGTIGHEAFLRSLGDGGLSPWNLFSANASDTHLVAFDRLVRTVHALNFRHHHPTGGLLFLNVHGRLLAAVGDNHGAFFHRLLAAAGIDPARVVLEMPVAASQQTELLAFILANFRRNGFKVAVNVDSVAQWQIIARRVATDFVKIDAATLIDDEGAGGLQEMLAACRGTTLVATRLEFRLPAALAQPGLLVQGYAYGKPRHLTHGSIGADGPARAPGHANTLIR